MRQMMNVMKRVTKDEEGAALVEYALLVGLIALVCIGAVTVLGTTIANVLSTIASSLKASLTS